MKKSLRILVALSVVASTVLSLQPAKATGFTFDTVGALTTSQIISCEMDMGPGNNFKFTANVNTTISKVQVYVGSWGGPAYDSGAKIYHDAANSPGALLGGLSTTTHPATLYSPGIITFEASSPLAIVAGSSYWLEINSGFTCARSTSAPTYTGSDITTIYSGNMIRMIGGYAGYSDSVSVMFAIFTQVPATLPGSPTSVSAVLTGSTTANVSFTAPISDGGAAITSYTATSSPGGITGTISQAGSGTIAMAGLAGGTAYTFTVTATNSVGTSSSSSASSSLTTIGTLYNGTSGDVACTSGYFTILNNVVTRTSNYSCAGSAVIPVGVTSVAGWAFQERDLTSISIPNTVVTIGSYAFSFQFHLTSLTIPDSVLTVGDSAFTGLNLISTYEYCGTSLTSTNLTYAGLGTKTKTCTPRFTSPGSAISVVATATGKRSAKVSFDANASDGGAVVTSFTATSIPGGLTQTLTQATGGTFNFEGLQPGTEYIFGVTAINAIGTSPATFSLAVKTDALVVASLKELTFVDDGKGTSGKIVWAGMSIDSVLYKGSKEFYPGPFNYGAFTSGWTGRIRNLTPNTTYDISIVAFSADGVGGEKSLTFTTNVAPPSTQNIFDNLTGISIVTPLPALTDAEKLTQLLQWVDQNTYVTGEAAQMSKALTDFANLKTSPSSSRVRLPIPSVLTVMATSLTPLACSVVSPTADVDAGMVTALTTDKCTISYTVTGGSSAPATLERDLVFTYFELKCGSGTYKLKAGVVSHGYTCTGDVTIDATATSIAFGAFQFSAISSIKIPNSVTAIPSNAFRVSRRLIKIELGNAVTSIGNAAFGSTGLVSISLPISLRTIGDDAFAGSLLTSLTIPVGTTKVDSWAFGEIKTLKTIIIPITVTDMNGYALARSGFETVNYCGNNASVLAAIARTGITPTCVVPALVP